MPKVRFLILSDTHSRQLFPASDKQHAYRLPLPKADVLLHCGDLTNQGRLDEYEKSLEMLGSVDAELKLVIAGNHDLSLDKKYWDEERYGSQPEENHVKALEMWKGDRARRAGVTYLEEGLYSFTLKGGAKFSVSTQCYEMIGRILVAYSLLFPMLRIEKVAWCSMLAG